MRVALYEHNNLSHVFKMEICPYLRVVDRLMFHLALRCNTVQLRTYLAELEMRHPDKISAAFQNKIYAWLKQVFQHTQSYVDALDLGIDNAQADILPSSWPIMDRLFMDRATNSSDHPGYNYQPFLMAVLEFARIPVNDFNAQSLYYLSPTSWLCSRDRPWATMMVRVPHKCGNHIYIEDTRIYRGEHSRPWFVPECVRILEIDTIAGQSLVDMPPAPSVQIVYVFCEDSTDVDSDEDSCTHISTRSFPNLDTLHAIHGDCDIECDADTPAWSKLIVGSSNSTHASVRMSRANPHLRQLYIWNWTDDSDDESPKLLDLLVQHAEVPAQVTIHHTAYNELPQLMADYRHQIDNRVVALRILIL